MPYFTGFEVHSARGPGESAVFHEVFLLAHCPRYLSELMLLNKQLLSSVRADDPSRTGSRERLHIRTDRIYPY